jgi:signal transduction histidine kinase
MTPAEPDPTPTSAHLPRLVELDAGGQIEELRTRIDALERERDGLREFAARAAHELVAPLVMTEAYGAMILARLDANQHDLIHDVDSIGRTASQARRLVESLLAEAASGDQPPRREPVSLSGILADVGRTLGPEIAARAARVEAGELPEVMGEPTLLCSVFTNLMVNALRYGPREGMSIRVSASPEEGGFWRLEVDSDGPPISEGDCERIFAPYRRGAHERRIRGAGLGLAICRRIVERHGGQIGVQPLEDGNRFWFTLPA